jgi:hypothetical protein
LGDANVGPAPFIKTEEVCCLHFTRWLIVIIQLQDTASRINSEVKAEYQDDFLSPNSLSKVILDGTSRLEVTPLVSVLELSINFHLIMLQLSLTTGVEAHTVCFHAILICLYDSYEISSGILNPMPRQIQPRSQRSNARTRRRLPWTRQRANAPDRQILPKFANPLLAARPLLPKRSISSH